METPDLFTSETSSNDKATKLADFSSNSTVIKREHESIDDFEHLEHDVNAPVRDQSSKLNSSNADSSNNSKEIDYMSHYNTSSVKPIDSTDPNNLFSLSQNENTSSALQSELPVDSGKSEGLLDFSKDLLNFQTSDIPTADKTMSSADTFQVSKFIEAESSNFMKSEELNPKLGTQAPHVSLKQPSELTMKGDGLADDLIFDNKSQNIKESPRLDTHEKINEFDPLSEPFETISEPPKSHSPEVIRERTPEPVKPTSEPVKVEPLEDIFEATSQVPLTPEPAKPPTPEFIKAETPEPDASSHTLIAVTQKDEETIPETITKKPDSKPPKTAISGKKSDDVYSDIIAPDEVLRRIGLDNWFNPDALHPKVEALIYWRDPKKSGAAFGTILVVLLSLTYFSFISVVAYLSLLVLVGTFTFRIYKTVLQAIQKTSDGHPFKEYLELELTLPQDKVRELTDAAVTYFNASVEELRRLFLIEDIIDSAKFGLFLWFCTHIGAFFNGMTLVIIAFIALFSLPKVYENNKTQIDANLAVVQSKLAEITSKIKTSLPIGKKEAEKDKEQ